MRGRHDHHHIESHDHLKHHQHEHHQHEHHQHEYHQHEHDEHPREHEHQQHEHHHDRAVYRANRLRHAHPGGAGTTTTTYQLGVTNGTFQFTYNAGLVADQFDIYYQDVLIHTTGAVSGINSVPVSFGPGTETTVDVVVTGPANTLWEFTVSCP